MKKNRAMRVAAMLLVLVMMTSCFVGGTFAKYVTSGEAETATARVAKWGVTVTAATDKNTFSDVYATDDEKLKTTITNSVESDNDDKVVAPGTKGTLAEVTIAGTPEVAVAVTYEATVTFEGWTVDNAVYCPLVITVNNTEYKIDDSETLADFAARIVEAIEKCAANYEPNENLETETADDVVVTWAWAFEGDDEKDTALGNNAENNKVTISITTTVTQID